jgi:hypothetical protein
VRNNVSISDKLKKVLVPLFDQAKRIDNLQIINTKYFAEKINIKFEDDDESTNTLLKTNYGEYIKFVENLKRFIKPNKESNNIYLQSLIEDYVEGIDNVEGNENQKNTQLQFTDIMKSIYNRFLNRKEMKGKLGVSDNITRYVKVDYTTTETITEGEPKIELYLAVDLLKGELNDENVDEIKCFYNGESLTERFDDYRKKWAYNKFEIDKKRLYFDFEEIFAEKKKGKSDAALPVPPPVKAIDGPPQPPPAILAQGGNSKKYTRNKKSRRTKNKKYRITQRIRLHH